MGSLAVAELFEAARRLGLRLETDGHKLRVTGRWSAEAETVARALCERKAEVLRRLRCPPCDERRRRPDPLGDGCLTHAVSAEAVGERWAGVGDRDVGLCLCCAGPTADLDGLVCEACKPAPKRACRKCGFGPLSVLNEARICGRCAARSWPREGGRGG